MPRLNDLEVVDHELKDFRSRALDTLKALDEFEKLVSEYSELKQAYEAIQKNAAERVEGSRSPYRGYRPGMVRSRN